jgi:hypothetical protein
MRKLLFFAVLSLVTGGIGAPASAGVDIDSVQGWNQLALSAVRATRASDADAARW